jgi:hypothetical protein
VKIWCFNTQLPSRVAQIARQENPQLKMIGHNLLCAYSSAGSSGELCTFSLVKLLPFKSLAGRGLRSARCLKFRPRAPQLGKLQDANVWDLHTYMRSPAVKYASNKYVRRPHLPCVRVRILSSDTHTLSTGNWFSRAREVCCVRRREQICGAFLLIPRLPPFNQESPISPSSICFKVYMSGVHKNVGSQQVQMPTNMQI